MMHKEASQTSVPYAFLESPGEIAAFAKALKHEPVVALDLEADSLFHYEEQLCLLQVSTRSANVVLDPIGRISSLGDLGAVLEDRGIEKVFHGADYDIRLLKTALGVEVHNLFDTMVAARFAGRSQVGLAALLGDHFQVRIDKKYQKADWSARPLKQAMKDYAALDTAYLISLRDLLERELASLGRLHWAKEEFELLEGATPLAPRSAPNSLDIKGAGKLTRRQLAVLQALLNIRDSVAKAKDLPPFRVASNATLLSWATCNPATVKDVVSSAGASRRMLEELAERVLAAIREAKGVPPDSLPCFPCKLRPRPSAAERELLAKLKQARRRTCNALSLDEGLVVNAATLEQLARTPPSDADVQTKRLLKKWQVEAIGHVLASVLQTGR